VTIFQGRRRYSLDPVPVLLAKTNQGLATLDTYRTRLEQVLTRLTALEFQNAVVLDDVLVVLQRAELTTRMAEEIERNCVELGTEGRLIRMRLTELLGDVPAQKAAVVNDYHAAGAGPEAVLAREGLAALGYQELLEFERIAELLGFPRSINPLDHSVSPRGYRVLANIPRAGRRRRPRARHPRGSPPAPGTQPGGSLPAALASARLPRGCKEQGLYGKVADLRGF
jgi:diadenylate cyclase